MDFVIYYLDDFLMMGLQDVEECTEAQTKLLGFFQQLGFLLALGKLEGPYLAGVPLIQVEHDSDVGLATRSKLIGAERAGAPQGREEILHDGGPGVFNQ